MLLLHISDIHFSHPMCTSPGDPERPYRTALVRDVRERIKTLGPVDAILVTGDIASKGKKEEYSAAFEWLIWLGEECGCPPERIFVVPGNHDVDRDVIKRNASVRNVQSAILGANPSRREYELNDQLRDAETGRALFMSIAAYNEFAAKFNCEVYAPEHFFWKQVLFLDDQTVLRVFGLTSTLLSGMGCTRGEEDKKESLYLSPLQTSIDQEDGVINLVMSHHPPDWFLDHDIVDSAICNRSSIHLFGHKHIQRITRDPNYVRFSASAVNPARHEAGWEPGYNLIQLCIVEEGRQRFLDLEAHLIIWQSNPDGFIQKMSLPEREPVFRHRLPIQGHFRPRSFSTAPVAAMNRNPSSQTAPKLIEELEVEAKMSSENTRNLILRFWALSMSQRREIALSLGLITQDEISLPEPERYGRALKRAGEQGLLQRVIEEVERMERQ